MTIHSDDEIKAALIEARGNFAGAAMLLGCLRVTITKRVEGSVDIQNLLIDLEEALLDQAVDNVAKAIAKDDMQTTRWFLDRKGRGRGYVTRTETTGPDGGPIPLQPVHVTVEYVSAKPVPDEAIPI